ncbi:NADH dehydrogenase [ubiquinone] 1 alpha subcomplex assembly factor 3 isoform X2 [Panulirus ornatus]|uniref:NADH dehydrogenase [ubiquinone] 1 alpha subcomplex assembly factor 3 isoform X2 n=1 Tax=Panulirus ornatus TaxID=150431 RepID=UPI003A8A3FED
MKNLEGTRVKSFGIIRNFTGISVICKKRRNTPSSSYKQEEEGIRMFRQAVMKSQELLVPRFGIFTRQPRCLQSSDVDDNKSVLKVLNIETDVGLMVDAFSQIGFRLNNGMNLIGPIAVFPKTVLSWHVTCSQDINEDSLSLFYLLEPKIDLLVVGVGDKGCQVNPRIIQFMKNKGINMEVLPTESACTTFNFLNQEHRCVAGAFIPPLSLSLTENDLVEAERKRKKLFVSED